MPESRCLSSCEVLPRVLKRCVRALDHAERHLWVEALDRSDGKPLIAEWDDQRNLTIGYITLGEPEDG